MLNLIGIVLKNKSKKKKKNKSYLLCFYFIYNIHVSI